jgi:spore maturation protein CgeB
MKVAFYGSSLLSSYWNGAATYYRGILRAMSQRGYDITFYEPDILERQSHRDIDPPDWCRVVVYRGTPEAVQGVGMGAMEADIVVKTSGVGFMDEALLATVFAGARSDALRVWWDVDAPATLAEIIRQPLHPIRTALQGNIDLVLTYGGGSRVVSAYQDLGHAPCVPVYNALDPSTHHPVTPQERFAADLALLANRLPDREERVEEFFLRPAAVLSEARFILGGAGWENKPLPSNVAYIGHLSTCDHNAFNATPKAVLNVNRSSMAAIGFSPPTRVFEAAGAGACLITDEWPGIAEFLGPGEEVLVARDGTDVIEILRDLTPTAAATIGGKAKGRILREHTYAHRASGLDKVLRLALARKREEVAV